MSYILDALKKAEQQREIGRIPGIVSGHEQAGSRSTHRWLWLVGILSINAIVLAIVLWPQPEATAIVPVATVVAPPVVPPVSQPTYQRSAPVIAVVQPVVAAQPARPAPVSVAKPPVNLRPLPPLAAPPPAAVVETPVTLATTLPSNNNLPVWPQVPSQLFQQLNGGLHLDVHVYSDLPAQRFVLINMQKYNEGERLQEGPLVDEITPEDVILSFHGQRFRVQSQ